MATQKRFQARAGLDNNSQTIIGVADPVNAQDAATKAFSSNASNLTTGTLPAARLPAFTGDASVAVGTSTITLSNSGATAGTYKSVTVDAKGRVTGGTNPTTLSGYGITDAQPLDADLTAIAGLVGTSGLLKKTAANTWALDTNTYLTGNQTVTVSGDATGSGTTAISLTLANSGVAAGTYNAGATQSQSFTVDAKGRVTGVGAATTITPAWGSVTGKPTTLTGYGITDAAASTHTHTNINNLITLKAVNQPKVALGSPTIDLSVGNFFTYTVTGAVTFGLSNTPANGTLASFILEITNGGSFSVSWMSNAKWGGGTAPTLTASGRDVVGFYTHDGGATWTGLLLGKDVK